MAGWVENSLFGLGYSIILTIVLVVIGVNWDKITKALRISKRCSK